MATRSAAPALRAVAAATGVRKPLLRLLGTGRRRPQCPARTEAARARIIGADIQDGPGRHPKAQDGLQILSAQCGSGQGRQGDNPDRHERSATKTAGHRRGLRCRSRASLSSRSSVGTMSAADARTRRSRPKRRSTCWPRGVCASRATSRITTGRLAGSYRASNRATLCWSGGDVTIGHERAPKLGIQLHEGLERSAGQQTAVPLSEEHRQGRLVGLADRLDGSEELGRVPKASFEQHQVQPDPVHPLTSASQDQQRPAAQVGQGPDGAPPRHQQGSPVPHLSPSLANEHRPKRPLARGANTARWSSSRTALCPEPCPPRARRDPRRFRRRLQSPVPRA